MKFEEFRTLHDINTEIPEGKLLLAALGVLTSIRTANTPDKELVDVVAKASRMFPASPSAYAQDRDAKYHTKDYRDMSGWWHQTCVDTDRMPSYAKGAVTPDDEATETDTEFLAEEIDDLRKDVDGYVDAVAGDVDGLREHIDTLVDGCYARTDRLGRRVESLGEKHILLAEQVEVLRQTLHNAVQDFLELKQRVIRGPQITYHGGPWAVPCDAPSNTGTPLPQDADKGTGSPPPRQPGSVCEK